MFLTQKPISPITRDNWYALMSYTICDSLVNFDLVTNTVLMLYTVDIQLRCFLLLSCAECYIYIYFILSFLS